MTIYKPLEPQPEIIIKKIGKTHIEDFLYVEFRCSEVMLCAPHKIGDEIFGCEKCNYTGLGEPYEHPAQKHVGFKIGLVVSDCKFCLFKPVGKAKSIKPVNKDGLWQWEIEVDEK